MKLQTIIDLPRTMYVIYDKPSLADKLTLWFAVLTVILSALAFGLGVTEIPQVLRKTVTETVIEIVAKIALVGFSPGFVGAA